MSLPNKSESTSCNYTPKKEPKVIYLTPAYCKQKASQDTDKRIQVTQKAIEAVNKINW